jgi:hypothetical protein
MSRLHNKFPAHFYRRGNLFNTYLGHTDPAPAERRADDLEKPKRKRRNGTAPRRRAVAPEPRPVERLIGYVLTHLSDAEIGRLLVLLGNDAGVEIRTHQVRRARAEIGPFLREHVVRKDVTRFLEELRRRKRVGEPLVRYRRDISS